MTKNKKSLRFSIRSKLMLLSLLFLLVPYVAYRSLLELETSLRSGLETSLLEVGNSLSAFLVTREDLLRHKLSTDEHYLFIHDLKYPVLLDGYSDEWSELLPWSNKYMDNLDESFSYQLMMGRYENSLYILLDVKDKTQIFHDPSQSGTLNSDYVSLLFKDAGSSLIKYELAPEAAGKFFPFQLEEYWLHEQDIGIMDPELRKIFITNIQVYWQRTESGYSIEIEIPWHLVPEKIGLTVHDVDKRDGEKKSVSSNDINDHLLLSRLIQQSKELNNIIHSLGITKNRRIWVLDTLGQVIAVDGSLKAGLEKTPVNILYDIILPKTYERFNDELSEASRLEGKEIQNALKGKTDIRWRGSKDKKVVILSAAVPILKNSDVAGVVVVEETTNGIQLLKRDALTNLFNKTLLVFSIITILILLFASYLSLRLRRLSQQANNAIDEHGRVIGEIKIKDSNDELGDLAQNYKQILNRLRQYHDYLEGMASKLSHELRTPITIVQSSLENLEHEKNSEKSNQYMLRAKEGIRQLNQIISRLGEATRLENSIKNYELESIEIIEFISNCVSAYRDAFAPIEINFKTNIDEKSLSIAPDLIVQLLDKLIRNAIDFHTCGSSIEFCLNEDEEFVIIDVINQGPVLPEDIQSQLFQSMTSSRKSKENDEPHLGLGLYIVRLIAEYHKGRVAAENLESGAGVRIRVFLPKSIANY